MKKFKTWVEINKKAVFYNVKAIKHLLRPSTELWAVVKSNAYGHGLLAFSSTANGAGIDGFCVDSVIEGVKLRKNGLKKPILVLGPTLSKNLIKDAFISKLILTVSSRENLEKLLHFKNKPAIHLKIDTGMHRQGFYNDDLIKTANFIKKNNIDLKGIYSHFASAKDINYLTYSEQQFNNFNKAVSILAKVGFPDIKKHIAATGGILINPKYHLDMVRSGIGLYGLWPSKELMVQKFKINFKPALSWHAVVSEIKKLKAGDFVGYDLVERVKKPVKMAIVPIGYWHGFPRALSEIGEMLIRGKRARVLGRVSMDLVALDVSNINCKVGDKATIIGKQKNAELLAFDIAQKIGASHYELVTRINPLIERIIV